MAIFSASWYYVAQEKTIVKIKARDIIEAKETMVMYVNNLIGGNGIRFTAENINSIVEENPDDYITYGEQLEKYKKNFNKVPPDEIMNCE